MAFADFHWSFFKQYVPNAGQRGEEWWTSFSHNTIQWQFHLDIQIHTWKFWPLLPIISVASNYLPYNPHAQYYFLIAFQLLHFLLKLIWEWMRYELFLISMPRAYFPGRKCRWSWDTALPHHKFSPMYLWINSDQTLEVSVGVAWPRPIACWVCRR